MASRTRETEARQILRDELAHVGWDAEPLFTVREGARLGSDDLGWWNLKTPPNEQSDTKRSIAYLRAYTRIAAGLPLYAGGILLERKRLWMDRSVMSRLEREGYVRFVPVATPYFEITEKRQITDW